MDNNPTVLHGVKKTTTGKREEEQRKQYLKKAFLHQLTKDATLRQYLGIKETEISEEALATASKRWCDVIGSTGTTTEEVLIEEASTSLESPSRQDHQAFVELILAYLLETWVRDYERLKSNEVETIYYRRFRRSISDDKSEFVDLGWVTLRDEDLDPRLSRVVFEVPLGKGGFSRYTPHEVARILVTPSTQHTRVNDFLSFKKRQFGEDYMKEVDLKAFFDSTRGWLAQTKENFLYGLFLHLKQYSM